jgi:hypothetical protein
VSAALIDDCERSSLTEPVHKLAALPAETLNSILVRRNIAPENVEEVASLLSSTGSAFSAAQVIARSFARRDDRTLPFGFGRFGDGTEYAVYYSALEEETCVEEVKHRARHSFDAMQSGELPYSLYYRFITCAFNGLVLILCGHEVAHPELISADESGYPFCQSLARQARTQDIAAFHAPSARRIGGVCVPVFKQDALREHQPRHFIAFSMQDGQLTQKQVSN